MNDRLPIELARLLTVGSVAHQRLVEEVARLTGASGSDRRTAGSSNGTLVGALTRKAMQPLHRAGIVRRDGDRWVVTDAAELARITQRVALIDQR